MKLLSNLNVGAIKCEMREKKLINLVVTNIIIFGINNENVK